MIFRTSPILRWSCHSKQLEFIGRRWTSTSRYSASTSSSITQAEVHSAKAYCSELLRCVSNNIIVPYVYINRKYDAPSYTLMAFVPPAAQTAYLAIRAFNLEIARIADTVSTSHVGALRLQFWRDNINRTFDGAPPKQPVAILLSASLNDLAARSHGDARLSKSWFLRIIAAREQYLNNNPYSTLEALEKYAESTYSTLLYLTLQALPMASITADHIASHIGKAAGIVTVLRGLPLLAFPPPPNHHSNNTGLAETVAAQRTKSHQGVVTLPLDVMADAGLREEDVLRQGPNAEGLRDAVFTVATRASDHLITARAMINNLRKGEDVGHDFEHEAEEEHSIAREFSSKSTGGQLAEVDRAFGVFMPAVSTQNWLDRLQSHDFDIFNDKLRQRDWKLPWKAYMAYRRQKI
jgi:NADH dehydrogenase [ubiquinone] 1 alpha subcomplex assembly factor 6